MVAVIVPAAGRGDRMGKTPVKKQFLHLGGLPIIVRTLLAFQNTPDVEQIVCAVAAEDISLFHSFISEHGLTKVGRVIPGGLHRQDSVGAALLALDSKTRPDDIILVHDAVRPFVSGEVIHRVISAARQFGAAVAACPVTDSLKQVGPDRMIQKSVSREALWAVQTPQGFKMSALFAAYQKASHDGFYGTDEAALVTHFGRPVCCVEGEIDNIKITTPADLMFAERLLAIQSSRSERPAVERIS